MLKAEKRERQRRKKKSSRKKSGLGKWKPYHGLSKEVMDKIKKKIYDKIYK